MRKKQTIELRGGGTAALLTAKKKNHFAMLLNHEKP